VKKKDLLPAKFKMQTDDVLRQTLANLAQGITGIVSSSRRELTLSVGQLFQKLVAGQFLSALLDEWAKYQEQGRIKDDYQFTEQHIACLQEMLAFLDVDTPDEMRFKVMKQIFLVAATESSTDRSSHLPLQYIRIGRTLSSGEILVLTATYQLVKDKPPVGNDKSAALWLQQIADRSGLKFHELVEIHEEDLIKKHLLSPRQLGDNSGVRYGPHNRLTALGVELCRFIETYNE